MIEENKRFEFFVTHVEAEEKFLKIWAQTDEKIVQSVNMMLQPLQDKFDKYGPTNISPASIVPHTRCCARGMYNDFARAKILCLGPDGMVLVNFIDYGNLSYVPIHNIRLLDGLPEANYLFSVPEVATCFVLADVAPIGGSWLEDVVKNIKCILVKQKFQGVYRTVNNLKLLKFNVMEEDFSRMLVERNMALYSASFNPGPQMVRTHVSVPGLRPPHSMHSAPQENWRMQPVIQPTPSVQKVIKTNAFKALQLDIGSVHDVKISYVEEGPCKFSVQLVESLPYLNDMMDKINSQKHLPLQESPIAGTVCLGRQTSTNKLCRVVLNSPGDTSCKVYYADYGHHEVLHFSEIYQIPDEYVIPNIFSIRFTLSGIINWNVTQEMKDYFGGLVHDKILKLRVCQGPMSPLTQYCDLFLDGKNLKDVLSNVFSDMCDFAYDEPKRLPNGAKEVVFVSYVESAAKFFVQIDADLKLLDEVMIQVEKISNLVAKINPIQVYPNMPCIALYDLDHKWYRASILSKLGNDKVKVFYVDYGNEEEVPICNLRVIPIQIVKMLPRQAIQCSINGFHSRPSDMELTKYFESLVQENLLHITVFNYIQNSAIVEAQTISNQQEISTALRYFENTKRQESAPAIEKIQESSFKPLQARNQKSDVKAQISPAQKQKSKNKNVKPRDNNWNGNWEKDTNQGQSYKGNNYEPYEAAKSKFRKDTENEQRHDNRFRKGGNDYQNGYQNNRYDKDSSKPDRFGQNDKYGKSNDFYGSNTGPKDYQNNDRFNRNGQMGRSSKENQGSRTGVSARLDRSIDKGSDKDSDTSSRSGGKRSSRGSRRSSDQRNKRDTPPNNRNRIGRWENEQDRSASCQRNLNGSFNASPPKQQHNKDNNYTPVVDVWQQSEWDTSGDSTKAPSAIHPPASSNKEAARYLTSTPISKIPPPNITVGAVKNCTMVFYIDPENFFLQLCPDNEELKIIMDKIYDTYGDGGKVLQGFEIKKDLQCIAQFSEDQQWYRAVVKSVDASTAAVQFIDYGNVEQVDFDKIKAIEPEFLKLPAQGVHCKLFCPSKTTGWTNDEIDTLANAITDKSLEAEFVTEENGVYQVLIREANSNARNFINDLFANGMDLVKEKEAIRNKVKGTVVRGESPPDYAALDEKWLDSKLNPGNKYDVLMAWFINPESFYCQLADQQKQFRDMMNEIQIAYAKRQSVTEPLKVGSSVIAVLPDDGVLYRAEVLELNKPRGHVVQYIDYGDRAMVDPKKIFKVERKFMKLPKQAIFCGLKNISPSGPKWSNPAEMSKLFNAEKFECIFHELKNDKYLISLSNNGTDISKALVDNNLAVYSSPIDKREIVNEVIEETVKQQDLPRVDINLLEGQTLLVKVSSIEGVSKFYVQFYTAEACQNNIDAFMAKKDPKVMPRLISQQVCLGAGCLVNCRGKWRRGVVVDFTKTKTNYDVRLIDSGEHENVTLNSMLELPGQLAVMQNQAIECALFDVPLSTKANETFKKLVTGKDVKIFVEKIECNKLIVRLFDVDGHKIKVVDTQNTEKISPVCNMQLLSSTHDVIMTWVNNSKSVWLQRTADAPIEGKFLNTLFDHYSKVEGSIIPEENELYAGLSVDGNWYRVKASRVMESEIVATLIDYGNIETIPVENLRKLEPQFYLPHQLALEVSLTVTLNGTDIEQVHIIEPLLKDKVFTATFYNVNRAWVAELMENGEKISEKLSNLDVVKETTTKQFEYTELPDMVVGEKYDVTVSYVDHPSQLWLQRREELDAIAELQNQLQESSSQYVDFDGIPDEKSLCLAVYSFDNLWYRAEVLDSDGEITTVRFIDYGNADVIENGKSKLKQMPEKWKAVKKYAIQCKLDVVSVDGSDWSQEACNRMSDLVAAENAPSLQALVITDKAPMRVDLFNGEQSICKTLVEEKLAAYIQSTEEMDSLEDIDEGPMDPRSAFVSQLTSIDEFWVQEYNLISELEMLEDRLVMASLLPAVTEIKEGLLCIAHFPDDNLYYRAKVLSHKEDETVVHYIDYGNTSVSNDLRAIPDDLAAIHTLSKKCRLAKPDGVEHWPCGINKEFDKLAASGATVFLLDVIEEGETCVVRLSLEDEDVAMMLIDICSKIVQDDEGIAVEEVKDFSSEERPPPIGKERTFEPEVCIVSYASSPSEFWIHKKKDFPDLDYIIEKLENADAYDDVREPKEGMIVAAKFHEDNLWYRSKILSIGETGTEVFYIDYGNCALAEDKAGLRILPLDLNELPPMAMHCSLRAPESPENWSEAACQKFIELVALGATEFQLELVGDSQNPAEPVTVTLTLEGRDVVDILTDVNIDGGFQSSCKEPSNLSGDSAIQSEQEQHATDLDVKQSANKVIENESNESVEIISEIRLCSNDLTVVEKSVTYQQGEELVKAAALDENQVMTEDKTTVAENKQDSSVVQNEVEVITIKTVSISEQPVLIASEEETERLERPTSKENISISEELALVVSEDETVQVERPDCSTENSTVESVDKHSESTKCPEDETEEPALSEKSTEPESSKTEGSEHSASN